MREKYHCRSEQNPVETEKNTPETTKMPETDKIPGRSGKRPGSGKNTVSNWEKSAAHCVVEGAAILCECMRCVIAMLVLLYGIELLDENSQRAEMFHNVFLSFVLPI